MKPKWIIQFDREFQGLTKGDMDWFKQFISQLLIEVIEEIPDGVRCNEKLDPQCLDTTVLKQQLKSKYVQ